MEQICPTAYRRSRLICLLALLVLLLPLARAAQATTIDIMMVYDNTASAWVTSKGGITAFSQDVVTRMNQAMQNSGIDATFRLVHSMQVNYNHATLDADLDKLAGGSGVFAAVDSARDTYGADLVALLVDTGDAFGWVGLGYLLSSWSGSPSSGLTANAIRSVELDHTLTHEVGHNLGAHHSKDQASAPGPNPYLDGQYSAGWYFTGTNGQQYYTIMAYNYDGYGNNYTAAPFFSTPLKTYQGAAVGNANDGDNARLIELTKDIIADYRPAVIDPDPLDPDPLDPDPLPDLIVTSVTGPSTGSAGAEIEVAAHVYNQGNGVAGANWLSFYLSTNASITLSDVDTGWGCDVGVLDAGGIDETCYGSITLPNNITPGRYYLGAYVDPYAEVTESDETNNGTAARNTMMITGAEDPDSVDVALDEGILAGLFRAYFLRAPDQNGWNAYTDMLAASNAPLDVLREDISNQAFINNGYAQNIYGRMDTEEFVRAIYEKVLNGTAAEQPSDEEVEGWVKYILEGNSRGFMVYEFLYAALTIDFTQPPPDGFTQEQWDSGKLRQDTLKNSNLVANEFCKLGSPTNVTNLDWASWDSDPAFQASKKIIRYVTYDTNKANNAIEYLRSLAATSTDPMHAINNAKVEEIFGLVESR